MSATRDARAARRGFALLALDEGARSSQVVVTFGVTRQSIYNWIARFDDGDGAPDLEDRQRAHLQLVAAAERHEQLALPRIR